MRLFITFARWVPWYLLLIIALAVILLWPSLSVGLIADDWWHYIWLHKLEPHPAPQSGAIFNLFSFASSEQVSRDYLVNRGGLPWWTSESLQVNFWRPVAELSHLDYLIFEKSSPYLHAQSIVWFTALVWLLHGFYQRIGLPKATIIIALLIIVTEPFHSLAVTWLANRNLLIGAVFVFLSLNCYLDASTRQKPAFAITAWILYLVALLSSEAATSLLAFLLSYSVCLDRRKIKVRALSILPFLLVTFLWLLLYRYLGYGASGNAMMYVDPAAKPLTFVRQLIERIPIAFNLQALVLPKLFPEFWHKQMLLAVGSVILLATLLVAWLNKSKVWIFSLLAFALAVVPLASALLHERNFIFLSVAIAPLFATAIMSLWRKELWWSRLLAIIVFIYKVVLGALLTYLAIWYFASFIGGQIVKTKNSLPDDITDKHILVIGAPIIHGSFIYPMRLAAKQTVPQSMQLIFSDVEGLKVEKLADGAWCVSAEQGLLSEEDKLLRDWHAEPFYVGEKFSLTNAQIEVLSVNELGNMLEVSLTLLADAKENTRLYMWSENQFQLWQKAE